ncbi:MAG: SecDF P1 head subdomain-containing protein, partial [Ktedonobacterales bacterium]
TVQHIGAYLTIALDNIVVESATLQSAIDGTAQITGFTSTAQARQLAAALKYGPLSIPFTTLFVATISPGGAVRCVPSTPAPAGTPTEPPNAPAPQPTFTPWPNPTPLPGMTPTPNAGTGTEGTPGAVPVLIVCGTATPGSGIVVGTPTTSAPASGTATPLPTPLPTVTPTR